MPEARVPVSTAVYDALRADILSGRLRPAEAVPSERTLSDRFQVNRHAVREAVKRLQQAGLVQVSHGGATRVRDWRRTGGLELLVDLPPEDVGVARAAYELRACIAAEVAARAAERATADDRAALAARAAAFAQARGQGAADAVLLDAYRELWDVLVDASGNIAYRLAYNSLLHGEDAITAVAVVFLRDELLDAESGDALVAAVLDGEPDPARAAAATLTAHTLRALSPTEVTSR